jgi:hypothetical protein
MMAPVPSSSVAMAGISDRSYSIACGRLASRLGISIASARRRVELRAAREGLRDLADRLATAEQLLEEAIASGVDNPSLLTDQLEAVGSDEHFMTED